MQRFAQYFRAAIILSVAALMVLLANSAPIPSVSILADTPDSSTVFVEPTLTLPSLALPNAEPKTSLPTSTSPLQATSSTTEKKVALPPAKKSEPTPTAVPVVVPLPIPVIPPALPSGGNVALDAAATALRGALVNIICYAPFGSTIHSISGSGVFIDSKGIILTNAHVAQYFLLADRDVSCTIRAGSPAVKKYEAALIFISRAWLEANTDVLTEAVPIGTGEYDFALLAVTKSATDEPLPTVFPAIPLAIAPPASGTPIVIASYGAQFLESSQVRSGLFPTIVFGSVKDIFTFAVNTIDVLALGGSAAAQEGSSGGGVADASGNLVGTITTSTIEGSTDTRSLDAITASYIRADFANETGQPLDLLLDEPTSLSVEGFAPQISNLESIITASLP